MAQTIVEQCDAVMPVPLATIADAVRNKKLCVLDIHVPWLVVEFGAIHLSGCTPSPAAQSLLEALRRVASESLLEANHSAATLAIPHKPNVRLQPRSKLASVDEVSRVDGLDQRLEAAPNRGSSAGSAAGPPSPAWRRGGPCGSKLFPGKRRVGELLASDGGVEHQAALGDGEHRHALVVAPAVAASFLLPLAPAV